MSKRHERLHDEQNVVVMLQCWDTPGGYGMPFPSARLNRAMEIEHS